MDLEAAVLTGDRQGGLGLEVEVVLAAAGELAVEAQHGSGEGDLDVAAAHAVRGAEVRVGRDRVGDREDRRGGLHVDHERSRGRATGRERLADDERDELADGVEVFVGQQRLVVDDRPDAIVAGDIGGEQDRVDAGQRQRGVAADRTQPPTGDR